MYELALSSQIMDASNFTLRHATSYLLNRYIMCPSSNRMGRPLVADGGDGLEIRKPAPRKLNKQRQITSVDGSMSRGLLTYSMVQSPS